MDLLTPAELSALIHVDKATLANWRYLGKGPAYIKAGHRSVLYRRSAVEAWLEENEVSR